MACSKSESLWSQHVSIQRKIRELHHYPQEKSIQQFFRDSPDLCLEMCLALEEKIKFVMTGFDETMRWADQCIADKDKAIKLLTQRTGDLEREWGEMRQQAKEEKERLVKDMNAHIEEKNAHIIELEDKIHALRMGAAPPTPPARGTP
jgi:DNA repair exonuclease SbcCD ATPase subunit